MSIKIGEAYWPPKQSYHLAKIAALGRSKIVQTARAMGITTPLVDTVSLPIGADEVRMIDMVAANATLAKGGVRVTPYAAIEARSSEGKLIYSHDRDGGPESDYDRLTAVRSVRPDETKPRLAPGRVECFGADADRS